MSHRETVVITGWRRLIGCLKLQVIFRKKATNYRALLRKMTYEDRRHPMGRRHPVPIWSLFTCVGLILHVLVSFHMCWSHFTCVGLFSNILFPVVGLFTRVV